MRVTYLDLAPTRGGSVISLERLLSRLDFTCVQPTMLLAECNPSVQRFRAMGVPVVSVPVFVAGTRGSTRLVQGAKQIVFRPERRSHGIVGFLWTCGRTLRNLITRDLPLIWRLWRIISSSRPDLVHINDAVFVCKPAIAACWLARTPAICHVRSLGRMFLWDRLWAQTLRGFIFVSRWVAADWEAQASAKPLPPPQSGRKVIPKRRVIYDGLDPAPFDRAVDREAARVRMGLPTAPPIVVVLGRLVPWKGQDLFLRAMRQVRDAMPGVLGLVVGPPERYCADFEADLHALTAELGLGVAVRFIEYWEDTPTLLAAADLVAHTSVSPEPFGLVMLEAMAARRPVVTPAEGGGLEIVVDGITGLLYEPRKPAALAQAILEILCDPVRAATMGDAGHARVVENFGLDRFSAEVTQFDMEL